MAQEMILVVDDERNILRLVAAYLEKGGFTVEVAADGEDALRKANELSPSLIVLDLMLPKVDGWEVCRRIRSESHIPIIVLTARGDDVDRIAGLDLGADDYLTKPFNPVELVARVKAVLRRSQNPPADTAPIVIGNLLVDAQTREASIGGTALPLRAKEFDVLLALAIHKGVVLSRQQLLSIAWGYDFYGETRTVDVHVAHVRDKLQGSGTCIETVWGIGYKLVENP